MNKELFRCMRLFHGMTQVEFGEAMGLGQTTINAVESGTRTLTPFVRARLAANFEMSSEFFAFYENYRGTAPS